MLFRRPFVAAEAALTALRKAGHVDGGADQAVRAMILLAHDLAVLM